MVLISIVIVNMIMAIIMDVYTEVKSDAHDSDPRWTKLAVVTIVMAFVHREFTAQLSAQLSSQLSSAQLAAQLSSAPLAAQPS